MALEYVLPSLHCVQAQPANTPATNKEVRQVTPGKQINHQHLLQEVSCLIVQPTHQHPHLYTCPHTLPPQPIHLQILPCVHPLRWTWALTTPSFSFPPLSLPVGCVLLSRQRQCLSSPFLEYSRCASSV